MKIDFSYPGYERIAAVEVPDANLMGVYAPRAIGEVDKEAMLARGFAEPFGAPHLRGFGRQMGGLYVTVFNWLEGPPAWAPALFAGFAAVGLVTVHLL